MKDSTPTLDYSEIFKSVKPEWGSNLTVKIGNPPKLNVAPSYCMWSDLLGFSNHFSESNWILNHNQYQAIYNRLKAAHSAVLYFSSIFEHNLILNDGIAKVFNPMSSFSVDNQMFLIGAFFRSCIELHMAINQEESEMGYPGCRSVIAYGESVEYLANQVSFDDYVENYTKPQGSNISNIARRTGNPVLIYNPKELQMNTAFSKSFILENGGSKAGLPGNSLYVDQSVIDSLATYAKDNGYFPMWTENGSTISFWIPYVKGDIKRVFLGFEFDNQVIIPSEVNYETKVYRLLRFYPFDENTDEFFFDLNGKLMG